MASESESPKIYKGMVSYKLEECSSHIENLSIHGTDKGLHIMQISKRKTLNNNLRIPLQSIFFNHDTG